MSPPMRNLFTTCAALIAITACAIAPAGNPDTTAWALSDVRQVAGHATQVVGAPRATSPASESVSAIVFDGKADGVFVPVNPIEGWAAFTIEVRFRPDGTGGGEEQRFLII